VGQAARDRERLSDAAIFIATSLGSLHHRIRASGPTRESRFHRDLSL
jgi:hypothetical protein